jgi:hypothetical protein
MRWRKASLLEVMFVFWKNIIDGVEKKTVIFLLKVLFVINVVLTNTHLISILEITYILMTRRRKRV